jgi:regulatory protein
MGSGKSINELNADLFSPEEVDRFANPAEARRKAMDFLARREYGFAELVRKLTQAGYSENVSAAAAERLRAEGLQDDRRFIDNFIQSRISQGKGPVRIAMELGERGLDAALIAEVFEENASDWFAMARRVRHKKFGTALPDTFKGKAKQMRFLQYRGFEQAHIQAALEPHGDH